MDGKHAKAVLVLSSGKQAYREYALSAIGSKYPVTLLESSEPTWQKQYITDHIIVDLSSPSAIIDAVRSRGGRERFAGVVTYHEFLVESAAMLAADLGWPSNDVACARRCRDKHLMRQAFEQHGVPSALSRSVSSLGEAREAIQQIGLPAVFKPVALAGSIGVMKVERQEDVQKAYEVAAGASVPGINFKNAQSTVLVEEFLSGPEISVESVVVNGKIHTVAITRKQVGFDPYFEEIGHVVAPNEPMPEESVIRDVANRAHCALGIRFGISHAELRLTPSGPRMIEVGARLGGDLIPLLVRMATGIDLAQVAAEVACGIEPLLAPAKQSCAAIRFIYPPEDCRVVASDNGFNREKYCGLDTQVQMLAGAGEELRLPPRGFVARLAYIAVEGATSSMCRDRLDQLIREIKFPTEPLA
jgi:biotin carboxylase